MVKLQGFVGFCITSLSLVGFLRAVKIAQTANVEAEKPDEQTRPTPVAFFGHSELVHQSPMREGVSQESSGRDERRRVFDFRHVDENGKSTSFTYNAVHRDDDVFILWLDMAETDPKHEPLASTVMELKCSTEDPRNDYTRMHSLRCIDADSAAQLASRLVSGSLLAAGPHWGCIEPETGAPSIVLERLVTDAKINQTDRKWLYFASGEEGHAAFFENLQVNFFTDRYPENHFTQSHTDGYPFAEDMPDTTVLSDTLGPHRALQSGGGWFRGILGKTWKAAKTLVSAVEATVKFAENVGRFVVDGGDFEGKNRTQGPRWGWNWDWEAKSPIDDSLVLHEESNTICKECFARAEIGFVAEIQIANFVIEKVETFVEGSAAFHLHVSMAKGIDGSGDKHMGDASSGDIFVSVGGLPLTFKFVVPISMGYEFKADVQVDMMAYWEASLKYGMHYDRRNGLTTIAEQKFDPIGDFSSNLDASISASATVYILPAILLQIQKIGGPTISVKPFIEFGLMASLASSSPSEAQQKDECRNGVLVTMQAGVQATVGADIRIEFGVGKPLFQKSSPRKTVYSAKFPIHSGCIQLPLQAAGDSTQYIASTSQLWDKQGRGRRRLQQAPQPVIMNDGTLPGTTWSGTVVVNPTNKYKYEECSRYLDGNLTLQVVDWDFADNFQMVGATNYVIGDLNQGNSKTCVVQSAFQGQIYREDSMRSVIIKPMDGGSQYDLSECSTDGATPPLPYGWAGYASEDFQTITASDSLNCYTIMLSKGRAGGGSQEPAALPCRSPDDPVDPEKIDCQGLTDERECRAVSGCGWCIDDVDQSSGCCPAGSQNPEMSCAPANNGFIPLANCNKEWRAGKSDERFALPPVCPTTSLNKPTSQQASKCWVLDEGRAMEGEPIGWEEQPLRRMLLQEGNFQIQETDLVISVAMRLDFDANPALFFEKYPSPEAFKAQIAGLARSLPENIIILGMSTTVDEWQESEGVHIELTTLYPKDNPSAEIEASTFANLLRSAKVDATGQRSHLMAFTSADVCKVNNVTYASVAKAAQLRYETLLFNLGLQHQTEQDQSTSFPEASHTIAILAFVVLCFVILLGSLVLLPWMRQCRNSKCDGETCGMCIKTFKNPLADGVHASADDVEDDRRTLIAQQYSDHQGHPNTSQQDHISIPASPNTPESCNILPTSASAHNQAIDSTPKTPAVPTESTTRPLATDYQERTQSMPSTDANNSEKD